MTIRKIGDAEWVKIKWKKMNGEKLFFRWEPFWSARTQISVCKTKYWRTPQYLSYSTGSETPPKENVLGLLLVLEDNVQAKEWWIHLNIWTFWKKHGSNNAKIILRWQWYFSAGQCTMPHFQKNANILLKVEINFAKTAWQLFRTKPHQKLAGYHKKVSLKMCLLN